MRRLLAWFALPLLACASEEPKPGHDPDEVIAKAVDFASTLERLDDAPFATEHQMGLGFASIYADPASAELFRTLDPMQLDPIAEPFAEGAMLVKENFNAMGEPIDMLNVMAKFEPGYNPNGNDWFFAAITRDGEVLEDVNGPIMGKGAAVEFCRDCHQQNGPNTDLVIGLAD